MGENAAVSNAARSLSIVASVIPGSPVIVVGGLPGDVVTIAGRVV
jgi:hypothetical protein